jgi:hypothetical protein
VFDPNSQGLQPEVSIAYTGGAPSGGGPPGSPPSNTTITNAKVNRKKHSAAFTFTSTAATGFQCALIKPTKRGNHKAPNPVFQSCSSPRTYNHLKHGSYTFEVRGLNSFGVDPTPATSRFDA